MADPSAMDLVFLLLTAVFFVLSWGFVRLCDGLAPLTSLPGAREERP